MEMPLMVLIAIWYLVFLFSTTCHEAAHALMGMKLGDLTAYRGGQVSLDPRPHIQREKVGMVVLPLITGVMFKGQWMMGWASAPYDPRWAERFPKKAALMALAGPVANLLLVLLAMILIQVGVNAGWFGIVHPDVVSGAPPTMLVQGAAGSASVGATMLSVLFFLNLILFVFNLLPLYPLDGHAVIPAFLSYEGGLRFKLFMQRFGLFGIFIAWYLIWEVFPPVLKFFWKILVMTL